MPASFKIPGLERSAGIKAQRLAIFGIVAFVVAVLAGSAAFQLFAASREDVGARPPDSTDWAGAVPGDRQASVYGPRPPFSSSDYTSGFDTDAAGLGPLPETKPILKIVPPRDARATCPDGLNCTFRPMRAAEAPQSHTTVASLATDSAVGQQPPPVPPQPKPTGLGLLTANMHLPIHLPNRWPSANTLLKPANTLILKPANNLLVKPFTNVSNSVVNFVKKL
jgi:hypothetical protein